MDFSKITKFLNPGYHLRQMREDLSLMRKAMLDRKAFDAEHDEASLAKVFRGRLFSSFFLSGPFGFVGATLAYWVQRMFENPWVGLVATVLFVMILTNIAYQVFWWIDNRSLYRKKGHIGVDGLLEMQRDLWPVHFFGMRTGLAFVVISTPINAIIIGAVTLVSAKYAAWLPVPILVIIVDAIVVQGAFVRIMSEFFDRHSQTLARKYSHVVCPSPAT